MSDVTGLDAETKVVADWLTENVGGRVVSIKRQPRWRPHWLADIEREHEILPLLVRGERYDTDTVWPLRHEFDFQRVMVDLGVRAPRVWGFIDKPAAFVMDRVPGSNWTQDLPDAERGTI